LSVAVAEACRQAGETRKAINEGMCLSRISAGFSLRHLSTMAKWRPSLTAACFREVMLPCGKFVVARCDSQVQDGAVESASTCP
jgi:hypothetical protein